MQSLQAMQEIAYQNDSGKQRWSTQQFQHGDETVILHVYLMRGDISL